MKITPTFLGKNIFEIPVSFYQKKGYEVLLFDLDNTLDSYRKKLPSSRASSYITSLKEAGLTVIIVSNNQKRRVKRYAEKIPCPYLFRAGKPSPKKILACLKKIGADPKKVLLCGDQLLTDVKAGNRGKIDTILLSPLGKEEAPWTKFNRWMEKKRRREIIREGSVPSWEESYEQD